MGWILLFVGIGSRRDQRRREEVEHTRTTGRIVDYVGHEVRRSKGGGYVYWRSVIEFTAEGQAYRLDYGNQMDQKQHPAGKSVEVLHGFTQWLTQRFWRISMADEKANMDC